MVLNCRIPNLQEEALQDSFKERFKNSPDKLTDAEARVKRLKEVMDATEGVSQVWRRADEGAATARHLVWERMNQQLNKQGLENVSAGRNIKSNLYRFYNSLRRKSTGFIDESIANLELEQAMRRTNNQLDQIAKQYNLNAHQTGLMKTMGVEVGWQPFIADYHSVSSNGLRYLQSEQVRYIKKLQEFGLTDADIDQVLKLTKEPVEVFHEMLMLTKQAGVKVGDLTKSGMGYFPHIYSEDYLKRMNWEKEFTGDGQAVYKLGDGQRLNTQDAFNASRQTTLWIVEDEVILDHLLTKYGGKNVYDNIGERIGRDVKGIQDLYDNDMILDDAIKNVLPEGTVDHLTQMGVMSKIPMTSDRVFNKLTEAYKLPYDNINQLMATDYGLALHQYKKQLEELAVDSNFTYALVRGSVEQGWGVSEREILSNPEQFRGYRPLNALIPEDLQEKFLLKNDGFDDELLSKTYVSPETAQIIKTQFHVVKSPALLGILGQGLNELNKWTSTLMLSSFPYAGKQYVGNFIQLLSAGGNPFNMLDLTTRRVAAGVARKDIIEMLDNTKLAYRVAGEELTERQLYKKLVGTGYINDYTQFGIQAGMKGYKPPENLIKQLQSTAVQMKATLEQYPNHWGKVGQEAYSYLDDLVNNKVGSMARLANAEFENVAKFSLAKTAFSKNKVTPFITGAPSLSRIKTLDDFEDYASRYFYHYDEKVLGGTPLEGAFKVAQTVIPFLNYNTKNLHGTLKQVIRNPSRFANYYKAYTHFNEPMEKEDLPAGSIPDYAFDNFPVFWKIDKESSGLEHDAYFYYPMGQLIQQFGAVAEAKEWVDLLLGEDPRLVKDNDPNKKDNIVRDIINEKTYPYIKAAVASVTDINPQTGKPFEKFKGQKSSFLGVEVSPKTKFMLEQFMPPLTRLDRWNPNDVFGQMEREDEYTGETIEGKPSWTGATRYHTDNADKSPFKENWVGTIQSLTGTKPYFIDQARGMGMTEADIKESIRESRKILGSLKYQLDKVNSPQEKARLEKQIILTKDFIYTLEVEQTKVEEWRKSHGFNTQEGNKQLRKSRLKAKDLPALTPEQTDRIKRSLN